MQKIISLITVFTIISSISIFAQQDQKHGNNSNYDYKLISASNNSVEIEYIPEYIDETEFKNAVHNSINYGKPDLGSRNFPIVTPSGSNNRIEILDMQYKDVPNITVKPVPVPKKTNNKLEVAFEYKTDDKIYGLNFLFPRNTAEFVQDGMFRDKHVGIAKINAVQFNPLSKTIRKITYLRFRVVFGENPLFSQKKLSNAELDFINGLFINWESSIKWTSKEYYNINPKFQNSVLASGDIYRIEIKENGFYKLDKNYFAQNGINVANIDPRTIKIYGNGGSELPYMNSVIAPVDPVENSVYFFGEQDGKFDDGDYLIFYGSSPNQWFLDSTQFYHKLNNYSNSNYYFFTFGGANGKRMTIEQSSNISNVPVAQTFKDKIFDEPEVNNLGSTGDIWVSQRAGYGGSFTFSKNLTGYNQGSAINFKAALGNGTFQYDAQFYASDPNSGYSNIFVVPPVNGSFSHITIQSFTFEYILNPGQSGINLKFQLPEQYNQPSVSGYYDYLEIFYDRSFNSANNNILRFNSVDSANIVEYRASQFTGTDVKVYRISGLDNIAIINPISYNNGIVRFQDNNTLFQNKEFYIVGSNAYKLPVSFSSRIPNQNLKGVTDGFDFIIITPAEFREAADRLKTLRESPGPGSPEYLKTLVVDINQIYNEFGGGIADPVSMRNYLKYAFNNWNTRPVYVLFLGDGSYDYKNIYALNIKNFIPPIERSDPYMNEITSYNSDDFICDINENWPTPEYVRTDFGSGRFCVNTLSEANATVDKLYEYASINNFGIWKKKIMYVADDGWTTENNQGEEGDLHTRQCESIAEIHTTKDFEKEKIYIVTYPAVITPQGRRKPGANADIIKGWNEGRLLINYTGHGSEDLWAHEHVFVKDESIPQMKNRGRYPLVTIASCDLARWDDPFLISAAEQLVFLDKAGAIGVIAATRPVYANFNEIFNNLLWDNIMFFKDTLNLPIRVGKAMYNVKNQLTTIGENDMKFCLVGDPSLRISIPQYFTKVDSINSTPGYDTAEIKALQKMRIYGSIQKPDSTLWNDFNGDIVIKVLDVDKYITYIDFNRPFNFRLDGGIIFKGSTKVTNGRWSLEFIVPKDISYSPGRGKILAYFNNSVHEGSGYSDNFRLNGIDSSAAIDTIGPEISLFMDSRNFRSGDLINQDSKIIADFFDENGINLTGAIGHKIEAIINGNENEKIDLTSYYNATSGYKYGTISYDYKSIPDGQYTLKLRAWDTYNNLSESEITFNVKNNAALSVFNVFNYPNPMKDNTNFTFQHNSNVSLNAEIKIFSVAGRVIKTIKRTNITEKFVSIDWDGKDSDGDFIANGTYIYKLIIKSESGEFSNIQTGKLAKLK
jgi:hypothetical protein